MIIKATQYKNFIANSVIKNKVKSINATLKATDVQSEVEVGSHFESFTTLPTEVLYLNYDLVDIWPSYAGNNEDYRTESKLFSFSESFTFTNPTIISRVEVIYNSTWKFTISPFKFTPSVTGYDLAILSSTNVPLRTQSPDFFTAWEAAAAGIYNEYTGLNKIAPTGLIDNTPYTNYVNIPTGEQVAISAVNESLYKITVSGTQPYYSLSASVECDSPNDPDELKKVRIEETFVDSISIKVYARTAYVEDVTYKSSEETPTREMATNELLQTTATMLDDYHMNYVTYDRKKDGLYWWYRVTTPKNVKSDVTVVLGFLLATDLTFTITAGTNTTVYQQGPLVPIYTGMGISPRYDTSYIYDPTYTGTEFTASLIDYMQGKILRSQSNGRLMISFNLIDENLEIDIGDTFQITNIKQELYKNGKTFKVYSIDVHAHRSLVRTIKALEVNDG